MILSHKYKFIFIKAKKVAGTSIEVALAKHCGEQDIITSISKYNPENDDTKYKDHSRNHKELGYYNHISPKEIKHKAGEDIWNEYFKFTVIRNPWDKAVSEYLYKSPDRNITIKNINSNLLNPKAYIFTLRKILLTMKIFLGFQAGDFESYIMSRKKNNTNTKFYFDEKGEPSCDLYMRYENLDEDYEKVCDKLEIPYEKLPKTKSKYREKREHYSQYFSKKTKQKIESICSEEIKYFNYEFNKT